MESHLRWPDSLEVPPEGAKAELRPGDRAKLMWSVKRMPGERMWVTITHRDGDNLTGTLSRCGGEATDQFRQRLRHDPPAKDTVGSLAGG